MIAIRRLRDGEQDRLREVAADFVAGHSLVETLGSLDPVAVLLQAADEPGNEHLLPSWLEVMREVLGEPYADVISHGTIWRAE